MLDLLQEVIAKAEGRCSYAEARHEARLEERVAVRNGTVDHVDADDDEGIGIRVRVNGAWGFAATRDVSPAATEAALREALAVAEALPAGPETPLAPAPPATGRWSSPCEVDPFSVTLEDKLAHLLAAEAAMEGDPRIVRRAASCHSSRVRKALATTDGAACEQEIVECGAGIQAVAVEGHELQVRTYPSAHGGDVAQAGWEHVLGPDLAGHAPRVAEEAVALLTAPPCPATVTTLVLDAEQLALQVHESIGHALELDRMLLAEAAYAGTSWVKPEDLGTLRYGSEHLNITADAMLPGGLGTFGWDDEGVAAARTPLVQEGILRAALSNRESAAAIGLDQSGGCARSHGFARQPIVRMTNVSIEPGEAGTLE